MFWFGRGINFLKGEEKRISPTEYLILSILQKHGKMTAKEIIDYMFSQFKDIWVPKPGTIYPILSKLELKGYLSSMNIYPKIYSITEKGIEQINSLASIFNKEIQFFETFAKLVSGHQKDGSFLLKLVPDLSGITETYFKRLEKYHEFLKQEIKKVEKILKKSLNKDTSEEIIEEDNQIQIK